MVDVNGEVGEPIGLAYFNFVKHLFESLSV